CQYTVTIKTGCVDHAGTDANVNAVFFTSQGQTLMFRNLDHKNYNDFERCHTDVFGGLSAPCLGEYDHICKMELSHDNWGGEAPWFVEWVEIAPPETDEPYKFSQPTQFVVRAWLEYDSLRYKVNYC
ncbi:hypothetical protein SELMODRAFT_98256, partial [Selaginella moellendorffii]